MTMAEQLAAQAIKMKEKADKKKALKAAQEEANGPAKPDVSKMTM